MKAILKFLWIIFAEKWLHDNLECSK